MKLADTAARQEEELRTLRRDHKKLGEDLVTERALRRKYYNMVEDMKGKVRLCGGVGADGRSACTAAPAP